MTEKEALIKWIRSSEKLQECLKYMEGEELDSTSKDFWNLDEAFWNLYNQCKQDQESWYRLVKEHKDKMNDKPN